jgi:basic membrane lipoprotein Med (substrate-binding protein (PBP1-ABC) superfamily)
MSEPSRVHSPGWRRILALLTALALIAAACGGDDDDSGDADSGGDGNAPKLAIVYSAEWNDGSWGQAAFDGANDLLDDGTVSDIALVENVPPGGEAERALRDFAEQGFNPIIAHSFNYGDDVKKVAAEFPETIFVYAGGFGDVDGNVGDYDQPFYQAAYLEGILAAGATDGGAVAGAGGFEIPACYSMYEAFLAGAQEIRPDTSGNFVAVGDWYDVQLAKEAALGQADADATMFIGCGQGPTFGQIEAANDTGGVSAGYVGDMSELGESVLSSFIWNLGAVWELIVADVVAGKTEAQYYSVPLGEGGMEVVISPDREGDISDAALELFNQRLDEINSGSFEVPFVPERT